MITVGTNTHTHTRLNDQTESRKFNISTHTTFFRDKYFFLVFLLIGSPQKDGEETRKKIIWINSCRNRLIGNHLISFSLSIRSSLLFVDSLVIGHVFCSRAYIVHNTICPSAFTVYHPIFALFSSISFRFQKEDPVMLSANDYLFHSYSRNIWKSIKITCEEIMETINDVAGAQMEPPIAIAMVRWTYRLRVKTNWMMYGTTASSRGKRRCYRLSGRQRKKTTRAENKAYVTNDDLPVKWTIRCI